MQKHELFRKGESTMSLNFDYTIRNLSLGNVMPISSSSISDLVDECKRKGYEILKEDKIVTITSHIDKLVLYDSVQADELCDFRDEYFNE